MKQISSFFAVVISILLVTSPLFANHTHDLIDLPAISRVSATEAVRPPETFNKPFSSSGAGGVRVASHSIAESISLQLHE